MIINKNAKKLGIIIKNINRLIRSNIVIVACFNIIIVTILQVHSSSGPI